MRLIRHSDTMPADLQGSVVALGNFDGLHRGHQVVLGEAARLARQKGVPLSVVVTEPHPVRFFAPDAPPFRLTPMRERAQLLESFGVDLLLVLTFDAELAGTAAQDFVRTTLVQDLKAEAVVVGYDYRFGKGRAGDSDLLAVMGADHAFDVYVVDAVTVGIDGFAGEIYSSTIVREALNEGRPRRAAALLGHWWTVAGRVLKGDQRGRTIGFPTANVELGERLVPKLGVYAVRVHIEGESEPRDGVANLGKRPTFDKKDVLLEVHIFDFAEDIYDRHVSVELVSFLRGEHKFDGLESLKAQIAKDSETARTVLADPENAHNRLAPPRFDVYADLYPDPHPRLRRAMTTKSG